MIAACSGELAVKEAFADVDFLRRFIDFKRVAKSTAVAGNADLFVTCKTTIYGIVICKIADAVIKKRERSCGKLDLAARCTFLYAERCIKARALFRTGNCTAVAAARSVSAFKIESAESSVPLPVPVQPEQGQGLNWYRYVIRSQHPTDSSSRKSRPHKPM